MSGPQGSDQPWQGQQPGQGQDQPSPGSEQPSTSPPSWQQPGGYEQPATDAPAWQQPAYTPPQYPPYQPPSQPSYPPSQPYPTPNAAPEYGAQPYQQPGQYGQPGQPGQPGQYSPYGQPGTEQGSKRSLAVIGTVLGVLAAVIVAVVLVLGFWKPGFFVTTKLDVSKAQAGVQQILSDETNGYGAKNVKDVKCNNGQSPTVKKGDTFNCEVSIDGTKRQVTVTFQDDNGTYEVGRPK